MEESNPYIFKKFPITLCKLLYYSLQNSNNFVIIILKQRVIRGDFMQVVLRKEKKYLINQIEYNKIKFYLGNILEKDSHNGDFGYMVRSLYFDTPFDEDLEEKNQGVELRRKVRLRIYDAKADFALLEMKQKQGEMQLKRSLKISRADAEKLVKGQYEVLLNYKGDFSSEIYGFMRRKAYVPKSIVQYNRFGFVAKENRIRITFDSKISATESSFQLFSEKLNLNPVMDRSLAVLEIKYNGFLLSYIKDALNMVDKRELAVSKYLLSRQNSAQSHI